MRSVGLILRDSSHPRTVFYERLVESLRRHPAFREGDADILVPAEDTAIETNWPRFGDPASAFLRGSFPDLSRDSPFGRYLNAIGRYAQANPEKRLLIVNMQPVLRLPLLFKPLANVIVADGCLAQFERSINPRTISMPALPMVCPQQAAPLPRTILASFQGARSHPVRDQLARLHDGRQFVVRFVDRIHHFGRIDAEKKQTDAGYEELLDRSIFAFIPRGDAIFSYRLLEAMARGAIPIILSDGWVPPFDRSLDWRSLSLTVHQEAVAQIPVALGALTRVEIERMQANVAAAFARCFADLDAIVHTLLEEMEHLA